MDFQKTSEVCIDIDNDTSIIKTYIGLYSNLIQFGIDPGTTHIGFAYVYRTRAYLFEIATKRLDNPVDRIKFMQTVLTYCLGDFLLGTTCIIEGAAFGNPYRQAELAEIRASAVLWCIKYAIEPVIVPPTTIRKQVMGGGKIKPEEIWTNLPPNAANALACALYLPVL